MNSKDHTNMIIHTILGIRTQHYCGYCCGDSDPTISTSYNFYDNCESNDNKDSSDTDPAIPPSYRDCNDCLDINNTRTSSGQYHLYPRTKSLRRQIQHHRMDILSQNAMADPRPKRHRHQRKVRNLLSQNSAYVPPPLRR